MDKRVLIDYVKRGVYDFIKTPPSVVEVLVRFFKENGFEKGVVWECAGDEDSYITRVFRKHGYRVIATDILNGFDFLRDKPGFEFDVIVTNPPYSMKTEFLERAYSYGKPFAFLLPLTALEGKKRTELYRKYGMSVIVLNRRVNFIFEENGVKRIRKNVWFPVGWFVWGVGEKNRLYYMRI